MEKQIKIRMLTWNLGGKTNRRTLEQWRNVGDDVGAGWARYVDDMLSTQSGLIDNMPSRGMPDIFAIGLQEVPTKSHFHHMLHERLEEITGKDTWLWKRVRNKSKVRVLGESFDQELVVYWHTPTVEVIVLRGGSTCYDVSRACTKGAVGLNLLFRNRRGRAGIYDNLVFVSTHFPFLTEKKAGLEARNRAYHSLMNRLLPKLLAVDRKKYSFRLAKDNVTLLTMGDLNYRRVRGVDQLTQQRLTEKPAGKVTPFPPGRVV